MDRFMRWGNRTKTTEALPSFTTDSFLHLSDNKTLHKLTPMVPKFTGMGNTILEETTMPRVCLAPTIEGCLLGIPFSDKKFPVKLYLYKTIGRLRVVTNKELIEKKLVFDANITGELWSVEDVSVKLIGALEVFEDIERTINYVPILPDGFISKELLLKDGTLNAYLRRYDYTEY